MLPSRESLAFSTNIRPHWNGLTGTNTLAYNEHYLITAVWSLGNMRPYISEFTCLYNSTCSSQSSKLFSMSLRGLWEVLLAWKAFQGQTLWPFTKYSSITTEKSFITLAQGVWRHLPGFQAQHVHLRHGRPGEEGQRSGNNEITHLCRYKLERLSPASIY